MNVDPTLFSLIDTLALVGTLFSTAFVFFYLGAFFFALIASLSRNALCFLKTISSSSIFFILDFFF
jgi:hypothetical protein